MKIIDLEEQEERRNFALEAAGYFKNNPKKNSYTSSSIEKGALFALKWGVGDDCVLLFKIADEPEIYAQVIGKDKK